MYMCMVSHGPMSSLCSSAWLLQLRSACDIACSPFPMLQGFVTGVYVVALTCALAGWLPAVAVAATAASLPAAKELLGYAVANR